MSILDDALTHLSELPGNFQAQSMEALFGGKPPTSPVEEVAQQLESGTPEQLTGGLIGKETIKSIFEWNIIGSLISSAVGPFLNEVARIVNYALPIVPMSPPDLADAVVRGFYNPDRATHDAALSGVNSDDFTVLTQLAGASLAPEQLAEALRRGIIQYGSTPSNGITFVDGIAEGRLANKWTPIIARISQAFPSPVDIVDATVKGQITYDEGQILYQMMGGALTNEDDIEALPHPALSAVLGQNTNLFNLLYNAAGSSPTPLELAAMYFRGIIGKTELGPNALSYDQGVKESHYKNKWADAYFQLAQPIPSESQILTLMKDGGLAPTDAVTLLKHLGMSDLVAEAYVASASSTKTSAAKQLAESTVLSLYTDQLITKDDAVTMLEALKYTKTEADFIMAVQDLKQTEAAFKSAVSKIKTLYTGYKIDKVTAVNALNQLQVPANQVSGLLQAWDLERAANVKVLSESQIVDAWNYNILSQDEAIRELGLIGYQPHDAWTVLSIKNKAALPGEPPQNELTHPTL